MYNKETGQISLAEFNSPFGELDPTNRWVRIAKLIPWIHYENEYAKKFSPDNGTPALPFRMAMGTLIIKQITGHSDDQVLQDIIENPYMQYLIGLHEFTTEPPFAQRTITNFRKYVSQEMVNEINETLFFTAASEKKEPPQEPGAPGEGTDAESVGPIIQEPAAQQEPPESAETSEDDKIDNDNTMKASQPEETKAALPWIVPMQPFPPLINQGKIIIDATCTPAYIAYPTDINLLNEAREKLEGMIDALFPTGSNVSKPRTYRISARKDFVRFSKNRKPSKKKIRKAIGQQLRYVRRNVGHVDELIKKFGDLNLDANQKAWLETIRTLYWQQKTMYDTKTHSIEDRIVSIGQPHVRPIVRGKAGAPVEFGAKVNCFMVNGYAFIDTISWDAYNEEERLIPVIERYKERFGFYPEAVQVDKIYRNRENIKYCKERGIRISGPRLGRPPKETDKTVIEQNLKDSSERNAIEGKFGEGKTKYGIERVMARLKDSSETVISVAFLCMNISKRLRCLLRYFVICEILAILYTRVRRLFEKELYA